MDRLTRRTLISGSLGLAGLAATGCTGSSDTAQSSTPAPSTTSPGPTGATPRPSSAVPTPSADTRPRAPLTGALVSDPAKLNHPAVAVKVPNLQREYPQLGIDAADIVFVEPNGPSYTRLCAVFHSRFPAGVNPIRSVRPVDIPLLAPMRPVFANTGAMQWVTNYLHHYADTIEDKPYLAMLGTGAYSIDSSRVYQISGTYYYDKAVVAHPAELARLAKHLTRPPQRYLPFALTDAEVSTASGAKGASSVAVPYGSGHSYDMRYDYDRASRKYLRSEPWGHHVTANGVRIVADNVLVVRARWRMAKIWSGTGGTDPVVEIINASGSFHYAHGGRYVTGTWKKAGVDKLFSFTCSDGRPLRIAPGQTWVELPQQGADVRITA